MSSSPISHSPDLAQLVDDGYEVGIVSGHLTIYNVPYVNAEQRVKLGTLISELDLAGDVTTRPRTHVVMFAGEYPCDQHGNPLERMRCGSQPHPITDGLVADHSFSSKPKEGYADYYQKMTAYITMISSHAEAIDPHVTARTRRVMESRDPDGVFKYIDTASSHAGITAVSDKLKLNKIAIIGLGGTGSYILDLVAKTPVRQIHLFDGDDFLQHNAFRSPGAASLDDLKAVPKKASYYADQYSAMRNGIVAHEVHVDASNLRLLEGMGFVFLCVDKGKVKQPIIEHLEKSDIPFIDVGMGILQIDDKLHGIIRVTTSTPGQRGHVRTNKRISLSEGDKEDAYSRNIQIADLNALNAALAVIKWKKFVGFYLDLEHEHFSAYTLDGNSLVNDDQR